MSVSEGSGSRPLCVATGGERQGIVEPGAALHAVRGHRLAAAGTQLLAANGGLKTEYSPDHVSIHASLLEALLAWRQTVPGDGRRWMFPNPLSNKPYYSTEIQKRYLRTSGCCVVPCPTCGVATGEWCVQSQPTANGKRVVIHELRKAAASKFADIGWHTFRHTHRSWLDETGAPMKVQQELMLHASIQTTIGCSPTLLLLRAGYSYVPYSSMESVIEQNKDSYYLALRRTQQTIRKEEQNWESWLVFFLKTMVKQKDNLAAKVKEEQALRAALPALSRQILELVRTRGDITVKEIEDSADANRNTIKVHIKKLAGQHYLVQAGKGRGTRYMTK